MTRIFIALALARVAVAGYRRCRRAWAVRNPDRNLLVDHLQALGGL